MTIRTIMVTALKGRLNYSKNSNNNDKNNNNHIDDAQITQQW